MISQSVGASRLDDRGGGDLLNQFVTGDRNHRGISVLDPVLEDELLGVAVDVAPGVPPKGLELPALPDGVVAVVGGVGEVLGEDRVDLRGDLGVVLHDLFILR